MAIEILDFIEAVTRHSLGYELHTCTVNGLDGIVLCRDKDESWNEPSNVVMALGNAGDGYKLFGPDGKAKCWRSDIEYADAIELEILLSCANSL